VVGRAAVTQKIRGCMTIDLQLSGLNQLHR
jgi:hypothetical protein